MRKKLWLTYAWKDNETADVDHVIAELEARGLEVRYDRAELLAGRRLWPQIEAAISDPETAGWAFLVTENSLRSEPCQEEIAIALDRALRTRGSEFPLIGIFPAPLDRALIPSAIATRLYVNLRAPNWSQQVVDAVAGTKTKAPMVPPLPFGHKLHQTATSNVLEVWPRSGRWYPFGVLVPNDETSKLGAVIVGPPDALPGGGMSLVGSITSDDGQMKGTLLNHVVDSLNHAYVHFVELPSRVAFGEPGKPMPTLKLGGRVGEGS